MKGTPHKIIVVLANRGENTALRLVTQWRRYHAQLMTPDDLSHKGWRFDPDNKSAAMAVIDGKAIAVSEIGGVVMRMSHVDDRRLQRVASPHRATAATQMNAFLLAWLSSLDCPMLNRPSAQTLAGPGWSRETWRQRAASIGIPVKAATRKLAYPSVSTVSADTFDDHNTVTIIGKHHIGDVDTVLVQQARSLAKLAGVELISVSFNGPYAGASLVDVSLWPEVTAQLADAMLAYLQRDSTESCNDIALGC